MRSVWVHFRTASRGEVAGWLDGFCARRDAGPAVEPEWLYPDRGDGVMGIGFDDLGDWEPEQWAALAETLGTERFVSVVADVTGRVPGRVEVEALVVGLLRRFDGVATHDYDEHPWTRDEIERGAYVGPRRFFDYGPVEDLI